MTRPDSSLPHVGPDLEALLRVAADLRDLPSDEFRARTRAALLRPAAPADQSRTATPSHGRPLMTADDIYARLQELAEGPKLVAHDLRGALSDLPEMSMRFLATLNQCTLGVSRFSTLTHWERHPAGDEMLHFLEGEAEVITLTADGPVQSPVQAGSIFICPQGLWHQIRPLSPIAMLFATPGEGIEHSDADAPPPQSRGRLAGRGRSRKRGRVTRSSLKAHDIATAVRSVPALTITARTTGDEADAAFRKVTMLNQCSIGVMRFSGQTPWERHLGGDELLHTLDGTVEVTTLTDDGPVQTLVQAGSVFVCPQGLWHRQLPQPSVTMLYGTPVETTEISFAHDPRLEA